ncbi:MAG: hypothetical protein Q8O99_03215 [bacterium]|nr:hypothetical protein [bacterium]
MFGPHDPLTKAQALTVIIRMLDEKQLDESGELWRQAYYDRARELELVKETDVAALDRPVTRYELSLLLYRASLKQPHE